MSNQPDTFAETPASSMTAVCELPDTILCTLERDTWHEDMQCHEDRRSHHRSRHRNAIRVIRGGAGGELQNVRVLDFSAAGLMLETDQPVHMGEALYIEVITPERRDNLVARPIWQRDGKVGCRFDVELGLSSSADLREALRTTPAVPARSASE